MYYLIYFKGVIIYYSAWNLFLILLETCLYLESEEICFDILLLPSLQFLTNLHVRENKCNDIFTECFASSVLTCFTHTSLKVPNIANYRVEGVLHSSTSSVFFSSGPFIDFGWFAEIYCKQCLEKNWQNIWYIHDMDSYWKFVKKKLVLGWHLLFSEGWGYFFWKKLISVSEQV